MTDNEVYERARDVAAAENDLRNGILGNAPQGDNFEIIRDSYYEGAKWALQNQWHHVDKELPEDGIKVIVLTEKGNAAINSVYTFNGNRLWHSNYAVLFWMYIPSLPEKLK